MVTYFDLLKTTKVVGSDRVDKLILVLNSRQLSSKNQETFTCEVDSSSKGSYSTTLSFVTPDDFVKGTKVDSKKLPCQVRCSCMDFTFTFAYHNEKTGSLYGLPFKPYTRKTDRPSKNPQGLSGMCKHIIRVHDYLLGKGVIK